jgi:hypothetical protein
MIPANTGWRNLQPGSSIPATTLHVDRVRRLR